METNALIALTLEASTRLKGKLWPNRLGFDARRWEYCYSPSRGAWCALYRADGYGKGHPGKVGWGLTPEDAKLNATPHTED